jgi:hypothetical protein
LAQAIPFPALRQTSLKAWIRLQCICQLEYGRRCSFDSSTFFIFSSTVFCLILLNSYKSTGPHTVGSKPGSAWGVSASHDVLRRYSRRSSFDSSPSRCQGSFFLFFFGSNFLTNFAQLIYPQVAISISRLGNAKTQPL